ncbi:class I SAM-dependent methyltransferase [Dactylosporangium sp. CS-033363]|uniref:class I SAM-dependent methyltransferase n=1 Tax=Dactylosporangium sp. CS-033363 TaxID=3239935 RepID=UPI003D8F69A1
MTAPGPLDRAIGHGVAAIVDLLGGVAPEATAGPTLPGRRLAVLGGPDGDADLAAADRAFAALAAGMDGLALRPGEPDGTTVFTVDGADELAVTRDTLTGADLLSPAGEVGERLRAADGFLVCLGAERLAGPDGPAYLRPVLVNLQHGLADRPAGVACPVTFLISQPVRAATDRLRPFLDGVAGDDRVAALLLPAREPVAGLLWSLRHWLAPAEPAAESAEAGKHSPVHPALLIGTGVAMALSAPVGIVAAGALAYGAGRRRRLAAEAAEAAATAARDRRDRTRALVERLDLALRPVLTDASREASR